MVDEKFSKGNCILNRYLQRPAAVVENNYHQILWNFNIQTNYHSQPVILDMVVMKKDKEIRQMNVAVLQSEDSTEIEK